MSEFAFFIFSDQSIWFYFAESFYAFSPLIIFLASFAILLRV